MYLLLLDPGMCTDGSIRLADGIIENEGRVEVCMDGVWGIICDQGWDKTDAHVVCTQMGHPELGRNIIQITETYLSFLMQNLYYLQTQLLVMVNILLFSRTQSAVDGRKR